MKSLSVNLVENRCTITFSYKDGTHCCLNYFDGVSLRGIRNLKGLRPISAHIEFLPNANINMVKFKHFFYTEMQHVFVPYHEGITYSFAGISGTHKLIEE